LNFINSDIKSKLKFMKPSMVQYYENDEKGKKISKIITDFYAFFINKTLEEVEKGLEKHISETKYKIYQMKDISKILSDFIYEIKVQNEDLILKNKTQSDRSRYIYNSRCFEICCLKLKTYLTLIFLFTFVMVIFYIFNIFH